MENESLLSVADLRKLVEQLRTATPKCPNCGHAIHKAYTCGIKLSATGVALTQRACDCNWTFELTPAK